MSAWTPSPLLDRSLLLLCPCFCCVVCLLNVWTAGKKAGSVRWHEAKHTPPLPSDHASLRLHFRFLGVLPLTSQVQAGRRRVRHVRDAGADGCIPGREALRAGPDGLSLQSFLLHQGHSGVQVASTPPFLLPSKKNLFQLSDFLYSLKRIFFFFRFSHKFESKLHPSPFLDSIFAAFSSSPSFPLPFFPSPSLFLFSFPPSPSPPSFLFLSPRCPPAELPFFVWFHFRSWTLGPDSLVLSSSSASYQLRVVRQSI